MVPEARKVQMVVVKSREEAESLKGKIEAGEMTMYQAARDYSIAAKAKQDLGDVGWVNQGDAVPALDKAIFALEPGKIGGPVEIAGWLAPGDSARSEGGQVSQTSPTRRRAS